MKTLVQIRDHDCSENRLLEYIVKYLNKYSGHNVFYGQATRIMIHENRHIIKLKEYTKNGEYVKNEIIDYLMSPYSMNQILMAFKINELVKKIKVK